MDVEQNKIVDSKLVQIWKCLRSTLTQNHAWHLTYCSFGCPQSNEVRNSSEMKKEGLSRSLTFLTGEGLSIKSLITDRHVQIRKYMRET